MRSLARMNRVIDDLSARLRRVEDFLEIFSQEEGRVNPLPGRQTTLREASRK